MRVCARVHGACCMHACFWGSLRVCARVCVWCTRVHGVRCTHTPCQGQFPGTLEQLNASSWRC